MDRQKQATLGVGVVEAALPALPASNNIERQARTNL